MAKRKHKLRVIKIYHPIVAVIGRVPHHTDFMPLDYGKRISMNKMDKKTGDMVAKRTKRRGRDGEY